MEAFRDRRIVVCVTGSIAAYKTCDLVFTLRKADARPVVALSAAAAKLVTAETFRALSGEAVHTDMWGDADHSMPHISLVEDADAVIVAPATANVIAHAALGLAGDLIGALLLCATCPVVVAPAMNVEMWKHPAVQRNVARLREDGITIVDPVSGELACRVQGQGKMAPVETILAATAERL